VNERKKREIPVAESGGGRSSRKRSPVLEEPEQFWKRRGKEARGKIFMGSRKGIDLTGKTAQGEKGARRCCC